MQQDSLTGLGLIFLCQYTNGDTNGYVMVQKLQCIVFDLKAMGGIRDGWTVAIWQTIRYWISALRCLENRIHVSTAAPLMTSLSLYILASANKRIQNSPNSTTYVLRKTSAVSLFVIAFCKLKPPLSFPSAGDTISVASGQL